MKKKDGRVGKPPANKIRWTAEMLALLDRQFPNCFNDQIAKRLKVSVRTVIRKARERGLEKVEGFEWSGKANRRRQKNMPTNPHKGKKGWSVPGGEAYQFGKNNPPPKLTKPQRKRMVKTRNETIKRERLRLKYGLKQETKLNLRP
jgi:hypothetical protein